MGEELESLQEVADREIERFFVRAVKGKIRSPDGFAIRMLTREKERLDQLPFTADDQSRKPLVPFPIGNFGFFIHPTREPLQLFRWDLSIVDPFEQVLKESRRDVRAPDFGQALDSVKA